MKILLPVDGSPFTKRMLAWLITHETWLDPAHKYTVLTVTPPIPPHALSVFPADELKQFYDDSAEAVFKPIRKFLAKHDLATKYVAKVGFAPEIIMGSHGHGNFMNLVMGSVATQVLARSKVPVLLAR